MPQTRDKINNNNTISQAGRLTVEEIEELFYAPLSSSPNAPLAQKVLHHAKHTRPKWYKKYHYIKTTHYVHLAVLLVFTTVAGFTIYSKTIEPNAIKPLYAASIDPPKTLGFQGKLTNKSGLPITEDANITFAIYTDEFEGNSTKVWQEKQTVKPDVDGSFSTYLGSVSPLDSKIFAQYDDLYLGISVNNEEELKPRQRLANVAYASNSQFLQGMQPITQENAGTKNVILALDSTGNLTIGGTANPTFQATGGDLSLSAQSLILTTNLNSDGNIQISPDGTGILDVQSTIKNTSSSGTISPGAVEILDNVIISNSDSSNATLALNNSGGGHILTASASGETKAVLTSNGRLGLGTTAPVEQLEVSGNIKAIGSNKKIYGQNLNIYGDVGTNILIQPENLTTGNLGIGTTTPTSFVEIKGNRTGTSLLNLNSTSSTNNIFTASRSGTSVFVLNQNGNIGLGTTTTSHRLNLPQATDSFGGINFGNDTNLFRSSSNTLKTDDSFIIGNTLDVNGTISLNSGSTPTTNGLCHSGSDSNTTFTDREIVACSAAPGDIAEWYETEDAEAGDIVTITDKTITYTSPLVNARSGQIMKQYENITASVLKKSSEKYQKNILGVVSTAPYQTFGKAIIDFSQNPNPIALTGRVPVKITAENGSIKPGDPITSSSKPGVGMKATDEGLIIGTALEAYDETDKNKVKKITILVNRTWYNPSIYFSDTGTLSITKDDRSSEFTLKQNNNSINKTALLGKATIAQITAGAIKTRDLFVEGTISGSKIVSQTLETTEIGAKKITAQTLNITSKQLTIAGKSLQDFIDERITEFAKINSNQKLFSTQLNSKHTKTDIISPLASNRVKIQIGDSTQASSQSGSFLISNAQDETVFELDEKGNATLSATLQSEGIQAQNASISGTLSSNQANIAVINAEKIFANQIDGLDEKISTLAAQVERNQQTKTENNATDPFTNVPNLSTDFAIVQTGLTSLGTTTANEVSVVDSLTIGSGFTLTNNTINTINQELEIQPLQQAGISFLSGKVTINVDGDITSDGNIITNKDIIASNGSFQDLLTVQTKIQTSVLSPLPEKDISVQLGNKQDGSSQLLKITGASGSGVLSIDNKGNIQASGSAKFTKLELNFVKEAEALSDTEVIASGSAGTASLKAFRKELTVYNELVTKDSLIYVTPISDTQGKTIYLLRQTPGESFTVGIPTALYEDAKFNWLIIN